MSLLLCLKGRGIQPWMQILYIDHVKINQLFKWSVCNRKIVFVKNWWKSVIYLKVVHCLRIFGEEHSVAFEPFERFCQNSDEPWVNMLFMPLNDLQMVLTGEALTSFINPMPEAVVSSTSVIHCHLNVWFKGARA